MSTSLISYVIPCHGVGRSSRNAQTRFLHHLANKVLLTSKTHLCNLCKSQVARHCERQCHHGNWEGRRRKIQDQLGLCLSLWQRWELLVESPREWVHGQTKKGKSMYWLISSLDCLCLKLFSASAQHPPCVDCCDPALPWNPLTPRVCAAAETEGRLLELPTPVSACGWVWKTQGNFTPGHLSQ